MDNVDCKQEGAPQQTQILTLLDDCARMMQEFYPAISVACLQLHHHIIPFLPIESQLSQVYGPRLQSGVNVKQGQPQTWAPCVSVLEGHTHPCGAVAFSPDGCQLVTGSDDLTVRL